MPRLSVVMIVKDEADCLRDCLGSVAPIADEIVVVDTGSQDDTPEIAAAAGAKVLRFDWCDDFSAARNYSLGHAWGDWLLQLDADEALDPVSAARVRLMVNGGAGDADAVELTVANYCDDIRAWRWCPAAAGNAYARGFSGYIAVPLLRLFRNGRGFAYREAVHENITASVLEQGGRILRAEDIVIHHYGYAPVDGRREKKAAFYFELARRKREASPGDAKALHDFAEQAVALGHVAEAEEACRAALALAPEHVPSLLTLANLLLSRGELEEGDALLARAERTAPDIAHVHAARAAVALRRGDVAGARARLESAPQHVVTRLCLARVLELAGEPEAAGAHLQALQEEFLTVPECRQRLEAFRLRRSAERHFGSGKASEALRELVAALRLDSEDPFIYNDLGVVLHALGDVQRARENFGRAMQLAPGFEEARANLARL